MTLLVTKASDDYWYEIISCETITDLMEKYDKVVIEKNTYTNKEDFDFWDGMKKEDIPIIMKCKYEVTIYDYWIE
jgi:hypothetical protein